MVWKGSAESLLAVMPILYALFMSVASFATNVCTMNSIVSLVCSVINNPLKFLQARRSNSLMHLGSERGRVSVLASVDEG